MVVKGRPAGNAEVQPAKKPYVAITISKETTKSANDAARPAAEEERGKRSSLGTTDPGHEAALVGEGVPCFGWLAANEKSLALLVAASKRPRRYNPLISGDGTVIAILLPAVGQYREAARALRARAMLRVNEGNADEAWEDIVIGDPLCRPHQVRGRIKQFPGREQVIGAATRTIRP